MKQLPLSVAVISFNEERIIHKMLDSISSIASEIIVVDSGSTDKTIEIAKKNGARVYIEEWKGHVAQKNSALSKCTNDWILSLDCDEIPDLDLLNEISDIINNKTFGAYQLNRATFYLGKMLKYAWQPDWNLRLVHKSTEPIWKGKDPHDKLYCNVKSKKINGKLIHHSYTGIYHHYSKLVRYAQISAESYHSEGKLFKISNLIVNPLSAFIRQYILRNAWKDGIHGFLVATSTMISTFLKYSFLWEIQSISKKNQEK
ncbi:glycosyltransferase family 2 protein [Candidatus Kapabacteria bacterium]|nr:glycosyltransferase family 2 protein [Candidatus Kapabacteria bacterium]